MIARRIGYAACTVALISSGAYVFVYLYRWEWNRALIAGVIFIAAELALVAAVIIERLGKISSQLKQQQHSSENVVVLDRIRETAPEPKQHFNWLTKGGGNLSVFVPVLMGAGVVLSAVAWLVERIAHVTARPALEKHLVARLAPLAMPQAAFTGEGDWAMTVTRPPRWRLYVKQVLMVGLVAIVASFGLDLLADFTQDRPDPDITGKSSAIVVEVYTRDSTVEARPAIEALWGSCQGTVKSELTDGKFVPLASNRFMLVLQPALGENGERRMHGCLEDAGIDFVQASVLAVDTITTE